MPIARQFSVSITLEQYLKEGTKKPSDLMTYRDLLQKMRDRALKNKDAYEAHRRRTRADQLGTASLVNLRSIDACSVI